MEEKEVPGHDRDIDLANLREPECVDIQLRDYLLVLSRAGNMFDLRQAPILFLLTTPKAQGVSSREK